MPKAENDRELLLFLFLFMVSDGCYAWASSGEWENVYSHMETEVPAQLLIGTEYNVTGQRQLHLSQSFQCR